MITIVAIIAVILVIIVLFITSKTKRQRISIFIGIAVTILSLFVLLFTILADQGTILQILLLVFYASIITFLVLWNKIKTKKVYLLLSIPAVCIALGIAIVEYFYLVDKIPTVDEPDINLYEYKPFRRDNSLAKLDEESHLKINYDLPVLDGATALLPVYASFAQAVYSEHEYNILENFSKSPVLCSKTNKAYENLLNGRADIIFCAGPSDSQMKRFIDKGLNIKLVPIGREAFVFFVNKKNPVNNLTIENIHGIYSGEIKNWKELNGNRQSIRAFQRPKDSGSQTMLEKIMGNVPIMEPREENVPHGMRGMISQVAVYRNFPNAIGYSFLFYSTEMVENDQIKLLAVDGIFPSRETIQNKSYPFSDDFYAIYVDSAEKNENTEAFIEWILSRQGQTLIAKTGYTPIVR